MKKVKYIALVALVLLLAMACKKKNQDPEPIAKTEYIIGELEHSSGKTAAVLWTNGNMDYVTNGTYDAYTNDLIKQGRDIFIAGSERSVVSPSDPSEMNSLAVYWKNKAQITLTNGSTNAESNAIAVHGNDIYVAGIEYNAARSRLNARLWKNGALVTLNDGSYWSIATGVAVHGNDVYVSGNENLLGNPTARLWKNGVASTLATPGLPSFAGRIKIYGNDIYVLGQYSDGEFSKACYWKNGTFQAVDFLPGGRNYNISDLLVKDGTVHLTGYGHDGSGWKPLYWEGNIAYKLNEDNGSAYGIADVDGTITIVGEVDGYPVKWENRNETFRGTTQGHFRKIIYE